MLWFVLVEKLQSGCGLIMPSQLPGTELASLSWTDSPTVSASRTILERQPIQKALVQISFHCSIPMDLLTFLVHGAIIISKVSLSLCLCLCLPRRLSLSLSASLSLSLSLGLCLGLIYVMSSGREVVQDYLHEIYFLPEHPELKDIHTVLQEYKKVRHTGRQSTE